MIRVRRVLSLAIALAVLSGGCPLPWTATGTTIGTVPGGGSSSSSGVGTSVSGGGATSGEQDFQDQLADQFPGCSEPGDVEAWRDEILRLVNLERARAGLPLLTHNQTLEDQAAQYACELIFYDFFAHRNPDTGTELPDRAAEFGYDYAAIGENLAAGQSTPAEAMAGWMGSPGHRDNILSPNFMELGVSVRTGGEFRTYWVQEFGQPRNP